MIGFVVLQQIWSPFPRMLIQRKEDSGHKIEDYTVYRAQGLGQARSIQSSGFTWRVRGT